MTALILAFQNISGTEFPSKSHAAPDSNSANFKTSTEVLHADTYAERSYGFFRSAFVADRGSFHFTAAGTHLDLSGNRNALLQGG